MLVSCNLPDSSLAFSNHAYVHPVDYDQLKSEVSIHLRRDAVPWKRARAGVREGARVGCGTSEDCGTRERGVE